MINLYKVEKIREEVNKHLGYPRQSVRFTYEEAVYYFNIHMLPTSTISCWKNRQDSLQAQDSLQ